MSGEHPIRPEDLDLYALGALDPSERQAVEAHVAACTECAAQLAEARGRMALLALAAPRVEPSPGVKERLLRQIVATAEGPGGSRLRVQPEPEPSIFARWWGVLAPFTAAFALATLLLWLHNDQLNRQLAGLRGTIQRQQQELTETRHQADLMAARETVVVPLWAQKGVAPPEAQGHARVLYNAREGMMTYDGWLPPAPPEKSYQLWLVPMNGAPISAGVLNPKNGEMSHMMMKLPEGVTAKEFAVTLEPAGGMPHPTGPMVLVGPVS
ncbi:MAG: anti-sigma factor [Candidatus Acidiferrales bacterium]